MATKSSTASLPLPSLAAALIGTWRYTPTEEGDLGYLHFAEEGVALQFFTTLFKPKKRFAIHLFFDLESPTAIRTRIAKDDVGDVINFKIEGEALTLSTPVFSHSCQRVAESALPSWFESVASKRLAHARKLA